MKLPFGQQVISLTNGSKKKGSLRLWPHLTLWTCVLVAYGPTLFASQFIWDDHAFLSNPLLASPQGLWTIWFLPRMNTFEEHYWPLTYTVAFFIRNCIGATPLAFHSANVVLHALNASLVFVILRRWTRQWAFWGALLFAMHPIQVESVAWIIELKNLLSFFLAAAALQLYLWGERRGPVKLAVAGSAALFLGALLSKSAVVPFPVLILLALWARGAMRRRHLLYSGMLVCLSVMYGLFDMWFASRSGKLVLAFDVLDRLSIAGMSLLHYLRAMTWPVGLCAIYPKWSLTASNVAIGVAAILLTMGALAFWGGRSLTSKRSRRLLLWLGGTFVMLSPTLGFIPYSFQRQSFVADRFAYHATAVFLPGAVVFIGSMIRGRGTSHSILQVGLIAVVGLMSSLTFQRAMVFRDVESLCHDTIRKNPRAWTARYYLADALARKANFSGAAEEYAQVFWGSLADYSGTEVQRLERTVLQGATDDPHVAFNRGLLAARKEDFATAMAAFDTATSAPGLRAQAILAMAAIELRTGTTTRALERIKLLYGVSTSP